MARRGTSYTNPGLCRSAGTWACFTSHALDEYGRLASDFERCRPTRTASCGRFEKRPAAPAESDASGLRRLPPVIWVKATDWAWPPCGSRWGRPRLAALDRKAAARDASAGRGARCLVFRERGDAGDRTALAAEEKEAARVKRAGGGAGAGAPARRHVAAHNNGPRALALRAAATQPSRHRTHVSSASSAARAGVALAQRGPARARRRDLSGRRRG